MVDATVLEYETNGMKEHVYTSTQFFSMIYRNLHDVLCAWGRDSVRLL